MMHALTTTGSGAGVVEVPKWPDCTYVLAFALCIAIVTATFLLFTGQRWGLLQVPAAFSWPQLHVLSTALTTR